MHLRLPLLTRLLLRVCRLGDLRADAVADLVELYERRLATVGESEARRRLHADVWSLAAPNPRSLTSGFRSDVRDAVRALRKTPLQTASVFLCLVLSTTLTVGMFTVVNALLAGELVGVEARDRLYRVARQRTDLSGAGTGKLGVLTVGPYLALPKALPGVAGIAMQMPKAGASASVNGSPTRVRANIINGAYFATLGTRAAAGRLLQPTDDTATAPPAVVIGYDLWQQAYGGSLSAVGSTVAMGPEAYTVVGVAPEGFGGVMTVGPDRLAAGSADAADLWLPEALAAWGRDRFILSGCDSCLGPSVVVRLAAGAEPEDLTPALAAAAARYDADLQRRGVKMPSATPNTIGGEARFQRFSGYALEPFRLVETGTGTLELAGGVSLLMVVPILVLAIACTNVTGVQLARTFKRTHEFATRTALGATRAQLTRLVVLETVLLALAAGATSWFVTAQSLRWTEGLLPMQLVADSRVFVFALLLPVAAVLVASLLPSWRATGFRVLEGLQQGSAAGASVAVSRRRRIVLTAQIGMSVALLGTALHLSRALELAPARLAPPQDDVLVVDVRAHDLELPAETYANLRTTFDREMRSVAGVTHVAFGEWLLPGANQWRAGPEGLKQTVTAEWFAAIGRRVLAGVIPSTPTGTEVVINESLAQNHGGASAAIGKTITVRGGAKDATAVVAAVVADGYERIDKPLSLAYYIAAPGDPSIHITTAYVKGPGAAAARKRALDVLAGIHPQLAPSQIGTVDELVAARLQAATLTISVLSAMSIAALLLAAVGLFGAVSQSASARVREFGVRLALGATPADIGRIVFKETAWVGGSGLVCGLFMATLAAFGIRAAMIETARPADPVPAMIVIAAVLLISAVAAVTPARRVMAINPVKTLRGE